MAELSCHSYFPHLLLGRLFDTRQGESKYQQRHLPLSGEREIGVKQRKVLKQLLYVASEGGYRHVLAVAGRESVGSHQLEGQRQAQLCWRRREGPCRPPSVAVGGCQSKSSQLSGLPRSPSQAARRSSCPVKGGVLPESLCSSCLLCRMS